MTTQKSNISLFTKIAFSLFLVGCGVKNNEDTLGRFKPNKNSIPTVGPVGTIADGPIATVAPEQVKLSATTDIASTATTPAASPAAKPTASTSATSAASTVSAPSASPTRAAPPATTSAVTTAAKPTVSAGTTSSPAPASTPASTPLATTNSSAAPKSDPLTPSGGATIPTDSVRALTLPSQWRTAWTQYSRDRIAAYKLVELVPPTIEQVCPKWGSIDESGRVDFLVNLLYGIALKESALDPANRFVEETMGTDPMTGSQVTSEGLFQLSYQDRANYGCPFDFNHDQQLPSKSEARTMLNPFIQIDCATRILKRHFQVKDGIFTKRPFYWAVLTIGTSASKEIQSILQKFKPCNGTN